MGLPGARLARNPSPDLTRWRAVLRPESHPHTRLGGPLSGRRGWSWGPTPSVTLPQSFGAAWAEWSGGRGGCSALGLPSRGWGPRKRKAQPRGWEPCPECTRHRRRPFQAACSDSRTPRPAPSCSHTKAWVISSSVFPGGQLGSAGAPNQHGLGPFPNSGGLLVPGAHPVPASTRRQRLLIHPVRTHVCFSSTRAFKCKHTHT